MEDSKHYEEALKKEKYLGSDMWFQKCRDKATEAVNDYCLHIFNSRDNVTRAQAQAEFWERMGDYYGFEIKPK